MVQPIICIILDVKKQWFQRGKGVKTFENLRGAGIQLRSVGPCYWKKNKGSGTGRGGQKPQGQAGSEIYVYENKGISFLDGASLPTDVEVKSSGEREVWGGRSGRWNSYLEEPEVSPEGKHNRLASSPHCPLENVTESAVSLCGWIIYSSSAHLFSCNKETPGWAIPVSWLCMCRTMLRSSQGRKLSIICKK